MELRNKFIVLAAGGSALLTASCTSLPYIRGADYQYEDGAATEACVQRKVEQAEALRQRNSGMFADMVGEITSPVRAEFYAMRGSFKTPEDQALARQIARDLVIKENPLSNVIDVACRQ